MHFRVTAEQLLSFYKLCTIITSTTLKRSNKGMIRFTIKKIIWLTTFCNMCWLILGLFFNLYHGRNDIIVLMKTATGLCWISDATVSQLICTLVQHQLKHLKEDIEEFLQTANQYEKYILQKHIDNYTPLLAGIWIGFFFTSFVVCINPSFTTDDFPVNAWYPFEYTTTRYSIIYISQCFAAFQCVCCVYADNLMALFFCYAEAKLDLLGNEMSDIKDLNQLHGCIKKHQEIINFVDKTQAAVKFLILKLNISIGISAICSLFPIATDQPIGVKFQFFSGFLTVLQRLYITAWPATNLAEMSKAIVWSSYDASWLNIPANIHNEMVIMLLRIQKPLTVSFGSFFPPLSLEYYANFMAMVFSYFTAMRSCLYSENA